MATPFTQLALGKLLGKQGQRIVVKDNKVLGLRAELREGGLVSFSVFKRMPGGGPVRVTIGAFPAWTVDAARTKAQEVLAEIAKGKNPAEIKRSQRAEPTVADLAALWLEYAKQHKRSWEEDERQYDSFLAAWSKRRLSAIKKADVEALHTMVGKKHGKYAANRLLALLHAMYAKAAEADYYLGPNPAHGIRRFKEQSRDRYLQPDELPKFFEALNAEPNETLRDFFRLCLLTGARRANVQAMRWDQLNLADATWRIPLTKSGDAVTVHLSSPAIEVLDARKASVCRGEWVFPGRGERGHVVEPKTAWKRICERAGLSDLRIHDLRRTLGSFQAATGASLHVIGKSLGHKNQATTAIYARLNIDPVRQSVDLATAAILAAAKKKPKTAGENNNGKA